MELADGSVAALGSLAAGTAVRVAGAGGGGGATDAAGGPTSDVYGWSHRLPGGTHTYVRLTHAPAGAAAAAAAAGGPPAPTRDLLLSPGHLVYVNGGALVAARAVAVGDRLATPAVPGGESTVVATGRVGATGKMNPHTLSGELLVDGVRVSTYTDALHPAMAHALLAPVRAAYRAGVSAEPMGRLLYGGVPGWGRWWA